MERRTRYQIRARVAGHIGQESLREFGYPRLEPAHPHPIDPDRVAGTRQRLPSGADVSRLTGILSLLADVNRARVLYALNVAEELCVGDLALALGINDDAVGYALWVLRTGLVTNRKEGRVVYYRFADGFPAAPRTLPPPAHRALTRPQTPRRASDWYREPCVMPEREAQPIFKLPDPPDCTTPEPQRARASCRQVFVGLQDVAQSFHNANRCLLKNGPAS